MVGRAQGASDLTCPPRPSYFQLYNYFSLLFSNLHSKISSVFHSSQFSQTQNLSKVPRLVDANATSPYNSSSKTSSSSTPTSNTMSGSKVAAPAAQDTRIKSILEQGAVKFVIKTKDQKWQCTLLDRATHEKMKAQKEGSSAASISGSESGSSASGSSH